MDIKPFKIYFYTYLLSVTLDWFLLVLICNLLNFDNKSAICVYLYGIGWYIKKGVLFFSPLLMISRKKILKSKLKRTFLFLSPFLLYLIWFTSIMVFEIESLYPDLSFGYIKRYPHFFIQLLSTLIISLISLFRLNMKIKKTV